MNEPIIIPAKEARTGDQSPISGIGTTFDVYEWSGSGAGYLHVHHADDEAWHVLEGTLTFKFANGKIMEAPAGTTVFVPAGVPHDYYEAHGPTRYLIIMTPRLRELISTLQSAPFKEHGEIMKQFDSEIVE